ncbi:alcohol dehydrogenase catalytic domain-containing protein, partial [Amycolatopsis acidicola]
MRAWQFERVGSPLVLAEVPPPRPAADEVLIDIKAAGLCHTDVGILHEPKWSERIGPFPLTLGHELAGVITEVGADVTGYAVGDRVGVFPAGRTRPGISRDGGYSFQCTALPEDLVPVPEGVTFEQAALGTDAGRAAYRAVVD